MTPAAPRADEASDPPAVGTISLVMPEHPWPALRRAAALAAVAVAGGVAMAGPAIHSEIDNTFAAGVRLLAGLIVGAIGAPMFVLVAWRKRTVLAAVSVFGPSIGAAVLSRISWSDDYSLTHIAVPLSYVTTLVTFFVVPDRAAIPGRCGTCGYDLRAHPIARCPECGEIPAPPSPRARCRWSAFRHGAWLAAAMVVCAILHTIFIRRLLSLG